MESKAQSDLHLQRSTNVASILNSFELDTIEDALLGYGRTLELLSGDQAFRDREAVAAAYKKIVQARKSGCCDAIRLFGM